MRKIIFAGFVITALIAFAGCGAKQASVEGDTDETTASVQTTDPEIESQVTVEGDTAVTSDAKLQVVYFDFDSYTVRADQQSAISDIAAAVANSSGKSFRIEGNCDEWGTEEYNYALGLRRAKAVQDALISAGVSADQLQLISYGESNPVCVQSASDCWRQNRRVETTVLQ